MSVPAGTVLMVAAGGVLAYAGFTGMNPLEAIRDVASGKPSGLSNTANSTFLSSIVNGVFSAVPNGESYAGLADLPRALQTYANDKYSQTRRWQDGYSDCSSFYGKGLKLIGIKPPGNSTTGSYLTSSQWKRVSAANALPGDAIVSTSHMVCYMGGGEAIGQENPRRNVQVGTVKDLMTGSSSYVYLRYAVEGKSSGGVLKSGATNV